MLYRKDLMVQKLFALPLDSLQALIFFKNLSTMAIFQGAFLRQKLVPSDPVFNQLQIHPFVSLLNEF